jgi:hypothetical protein
VELPVPEPVVPLVPAPLPPVVELPVPVEPPEVSESLVPPVADRPDVPAPVLVPVPVPLPVLVPLLREPAVEASSEEIPAPLRLPLVPVPEALVPDVPVPDVPVPVPDALLPDTPLPLPEPAAPVERLPEVPAEVPEPVPLELEPVPVPLPDWPLSHPMRLSPLKAKLADANKMAVLRMRMCLLLCDLRKKKRILPRNRFPSAQLPGDDSIPSRSAGGRRARKPFAIDGTFRKYWGE